MRTKMLRLDDIRREFCRLDAQLGVDTSGIALTFSTRMVRRYGVCLFRGNKPIEIRLAAFLQQDEAQLMQTARHEYAHAAAALISGKPHGHDALWRALCLRVGCPPERLAAPCAAARARKAEYEAAHADRPYYLVTCRNCGACTRYQKRGKVVKLLMEKGRHSGCICRRCGGESFTLETRKGEDTHDDT